MARSSAVPLPCSAVSPAERVRDPPAGVGDFTRLLCDERLKILLHERDVIREENERLKAILLDERTEFLRRQNRGLRRMVKRRS